MIEPFVDYPRFLSVSRIVIPIPPVDFLLLENVKRNFQVLLESWLLCMKDHAAAATSHVRLA